MAIHLKVHKHPVVDGKCREYVDETKRLIAEEVEHTPNMKISTILLGDNKTFLATHVFDDSGDGTMELLNNKQLEHIQNKFSKLNLPNVRNLVTAFRHCARCGYIDSILELKSNSHYDYIKECYFPNQVVGKKISFSRC